MAAGSQDFSPLLLDPDKNRRIQQKLKQKKSPSRIQIFATAIDPMKINFLPKIKQTRRLLKQLQTNKQTNRLDGGEQKKNCSQIAAEKKTISPFSTLINEMKRINNETIRSSRSQEIQSVRHPNTLRTDTESTKLGGGETKQTERNPDHSLATTST